MRPRESKKPLSDQVVDRPTIQLLGYEARVVSCVIIIMDEKIYSGALSLLGILVAFFTFALYFAQGASSANVEVRTAFVVLTGVLVFGCALSGLISSVHMAIRNKGSMSSTECVGVFVFTGVLAVTGFTPIFLWIAATWFHFFA